jgi:Sulfotransferase domain
MSFPNSGTSYTMELVMVASNMSTATNYAWEQEGIGYTGKEMPVPLERNAFNTSIDKISGPFWTLPQLSTSYKSSDAVLTKTHCGGYCHDCRPYKYVETPHSFLMHCATSEMEYLRDDGKKKTKYVIYDYNKIVRAVHLIRNPFDNMVSRYHLGRHKKLKTNRTDWIEKYTEDRSGFEKFCSDITHVSSEHTSTFIDQDVLQLINDIPCHLDLFRYIQWHNLAFLITDEWLQIPAYILHYEDYTSNFSNTVQNLLNFLQLPNTGAYQTFMRGKSYHEYFTDDQRLRMRNATLQLASPQTWHYVERYFPS